MKVTQKAAREESSGTTYLDCFRGTNLRRTIITIMPLTIQAMSGVAYISSYGTYYFQLAGISTAKSFQIACGAQALSIAGNIGAFLIIDRIGRRPLVLWAFGFLTVLLCVTGGLGTQTHNHAIVMGQCLSSLYKMTSTNLPISHCLTNSFLQFCLQLCHRRRRICHYCRNSNFPSARQVNRHFKHNSGGVLHHVAVCASIHLQSK
jgi:hypothetical protein